MAMAGVALPLTSTIEQFISISAENNHPVRLFSKPLDNYDFGFMCECLVKSGIDGFDLTVRPGGKVEPALVETKLPELVAEAKKYNLEIDMIVSAILSADDPYTDRILKTASVAGIKYYRLGWLEYDIELGIMESLKKYRKIFYEIAELNNKYNVHGSYQNHAGSYIGGAVWDMNELLNGLPAKDIGIQYDVRHAMVEGTNTWILGMRLIASHINTLAVKDFTWKTINGKPEPVTVPLGEGMVDWDNYFKMLKELNINGPITLHVEYPLLEPGEDKLSYSKQQEIIVSKLRKDMDFINSYLNK